VNAEAIQLSVETRREDPEIAGAERFWASKAARVEKQQPEEGAQSAF
jgi:hypothetical protein